MKETPMPYTQRTEITENETQSLILLVAELQCKFSTS